MRCFLMRGGHIAAVEMIEPNSDDRSAKDQAAAIFIARIAESFDGYEVWDKTRMIYRFPEIA